MPLAVGTRLGPYEILAPIGAGGMGEVFRANDTRLSRTVAIKVLPHGRVADPERKRRFLQEARAASALNHPNIVTLYDIANDSGVDYLVMEYVEGKSLDKLITRKGLPLAEALDYAGQVAGALAAAHEARIMHRDIKPGNVIATCEKQIKVLDFGLAKLMDRAAGPESETETQESKLTEAGVVMGTAAYMSPEQAAGGRLDHRTDIFSLGVVLYEMLGGRRPFSGKSRVETMHAIIHDPAPLLDSVPPRLQEILDKALEKDPRERYQHAGDLAIDLRRVQRHPRAPSLQAKAPLPASRSIWMSWAAAGFAVAALVGVVLWSRHGAPSREPVKFTFEPPENVTLLREGLETALSPDGRRVAFVAQEASGNAEIWVRSLDSQESQRIAGTEGAIGPFWSPDGQFLGFFAQRKLKKIALEGGPPQNICTTTPGLGATWSPSGDIVFNPTNRAPLMRVAAAGGTPQQLTTLDASRHENSHRWPSFLPDGRHFIFTARSNEKENTAIYIGSLDSKETKRLLTEQSNAVYAAPGYLLFGRQGTLMAQRFDAGKLELSGEPFPVAANIDQETPSANAFFSVSRDGSVITFHEATTSLEELTWFDRGGHPEGVIGAKGLYGSPRLSPDGGRLAVWIPDPESGNRDIWIIDVATGIRTRFTSNPANDWMPAWSPDGAYLAFSSDRTPKPSIYRKAVGTDRDEELLLTSNGEGDVEDWSRDGRFLLFGDFMPQGGPPHLWTLPLYGDKKPRPVFATAFGQSNGSYSPDGKWLAYDSNQSGQREIYVHPLDRPIEHRISVMGGIHPRWRGDGKELYYVTPDNGVMASEVSLNEPFKAAPPKLLFHACSGRRTDSIAPDYEVTPGGKRFLLSCQSQEIRKRSITVAIQWLAMVKYPGQQRSTRP